MPKTVITSPEQVTSEWLTAVLSRGALTRGSVTGFDVGDGRGHWSTNGSLHLRYSSDAQGELPYHLFLKMVNTDLADGESFGPSEVEYYCRDYLDVPDAPLVRCYDGDYSEERQCYHLLLEDVSATHVVACDKPPALEYGLALVKRWLSFTLAGGGRRVWPRLARRSMTPITFAVL